MLVLIPALSIAASSWCTTPADTTRPPDLKALYEQGVTYVAFRDAAQQRVEAWHDHYANAVVTDATLARVNAARGTWYLLVIAEDGCSDSASTIPFVAKLVDLAGNLEMRIVNSTVGQDVMEAHRTPDGRAATPTILLLNERFEEVGCFVERPALLQTRYLASKGTISDDALYDRKMAWYADDAGRSTLEEIATLIEGAARGTPICGGN